MGTYVRPTSLSQALECRAKGGEILAGGTDFWPARVGKISAASSPQTLLDLSAVHDLAKISVKHDKIRIGALTTWTALADAKLPAAFRALQCAAREVGGRQIQNRGTIGGNLCNASPAADGVPPLLALDASVELASIRGARTLALSEFLIGPRKTALAADEVLTGLVVPLPKPDATSVFMKVGARKYQLISIVMGAAVLEADDGHVAKIAIAIGACSPVAKRMTALERNLSGVPIAAMADRVRIEDLAELSPIGDIRADAIYRIEAALVVARRLLTGLAGAA